MSETNNGREIGLVSCTKSKLDRPAIPRELYQESAYFRKTSRYAEEHHDDWFILSAKHGVLHPDGPEIEPYEQTLNNASVDEKREWAEQVAHELEEAGVLEDDSLLVIHAGKDYYEELVPLIENEVAGIEIPTEGLGFGKTLQWYDTEPDEADAITDSIPLIERDIDEEHISELLQGPTRTLEELTLDPIGSETFRHAESTDAIAGNIESIHEGSMQPVVIDEDDTVIANFDWYWAAQKVGLTTVPVRVVNAEDVVAKLESSYPSLDGETLRSVLIALTNYAREWSFSEKAHLAMKLEPWGAERAKERQGKRDVSADESGGRWADVAKFIQGWAETTTKRAVDIYRWAETGDKAAQTRRDQLDQGEISGVNTVWKELRGLADEEADEDDGDDTDEADVPAYQEITPAIPAEQFDAAHPLVEHGTNVHLPVLGFGWSVPIDLPENPPTRIGGRDLSWWEDNSIVQPPHPYLLVEPVGHAVDGVEKFAEFLRIHDNSTFVVVDCGGFQLRTHKDAEIISNPNYHSFDTEKIHVGNLLEFQVDVGDAGPILDVPPPQPSDDVSPDEYVREFETCLELTANAARKMSQRLLELRAKDIDGAHEFNQLAVLHGRQVIGDDPWAMIRYWDWRISRAMRSDGHSTLDGYAFKAYGKSLRELTLFLTYLAANCRHVTHVHALMAGGYLEHALLEYFARQTGFFVTNDSAWGIRGSEERRYLLPGTRGSFTRVSDRDDRPFKSLLCECSVCHTLEENGGMDWLLDEAGHKQAQAQFLDLHTTKQMLKIKRTISALLEKEGDVVMLGPDESDFWQYIQAEFSAASYAQLYDAMRQVKIAAETGDLDAVKSDISFNTPEESVTATFSMEADPLEW